MIEWFLRSESLMEECKQMGWADGVVAGGGKRRHFESVDDLKMEKKEDAKRLVSCVVKRGDELGAVRGVVDIVTIVPGEVEGRVGGGWEAGLKGVSKAGIVLEIPLWPAISTRSTRQALIDTIKQVVKYTNGKNILLSTQATSPHHLRRPEDVANLLSLGGIPYPTALSLLRATTVHLISRLEGKAATRGVRELPPDTARQPLAYVEKKTAALKRQQKQQQQQKSGFSSSDSDSGGACDEAAHDLQPSKAKSGFSSSESEGGAKIENEEQPSSAGKRKKTVKRKVVKRVKK